MAHNGKTTNSSGWNAVFSWIKYALTGKRDETKAVSQSSVSASSLVNIDARLRALEDAFAQGRLGDVTVDSLDAQVLKDGGVDVRDGSTTTVTFSQASSRSNVNSGETLATMFGKVRKWFADLGTAAFKAIVTSWSSTVSDNNIPSEKLVKNSLDNKVDKVNGKGLSTNDYTTAEKNKLSGIADNANNYSHPTGNCASQTKGQGADSAPGYGGTFKVLQMTTDANSHVNSIAERTITMPTAQSVPSAYTSTPAGISTTGSAGSSTSWSKGDHVHPISLAEGDNPGFVKIAGQNVHVKGLNWCESENRFVCDINGSATSLAGGTPTFYATDALYVPIQTAVPEGYASWAAVFEEVVNRIANKGRVYAVTGGNAPGVTGATFERYIPATYVYAISREVGYVMFSEVLDDLYDSSQDTNHGLIRTFTLRNTGWYSEPSTMWPAYANKALYDPNGNSLVLAISNNKVSSIGGVALHAATATSADSATEATKAINDGYGDNIINTYARKQVFVNMGAFSKSITPSGSTGWTYLHENFDSKDCKPNMPHVLNLQINIVGADYVNADYSVVEFALTDDTNSPSSGNTLATSSVILPKASNVGGGSTFSIMMPFTIRGTSIIPRVWLKFSEVTAPSINGQYFYYCISC